MSEGIPAQAEQLHLSSFLLCSGPNRLHGAYLPWRGCSALLSVLTDSNAELSQKHPPDTPRNNVLPAISASLSLVNLTHKINRHSMQQGKIDIG